MNKNEILNDYSNPTGITYKHQPLFVGDVYENEFGTFGIVLSRIVDGNKQYYFKKENGTECILPENKAGLNNGTFVANVVQDETLMAKFIDMGYVIDEGQKMAEEQEIQVEVVETVDEEPTFADVQFVGEEEPITKKIRNKKVKKVEKVEKPNLYQKINAIRKAWSETNVEKEGKGRAGGNAKYQYYTPQQVIDFTLAQELKHNLYSKFSVVDNVCFYQLVNLDNLEELETVTCPFDIPRKMAASEAQQVGAAMTYHNRRLAMMMYKIEDNSKESVEVLDDANYSTVVDIPAPPIAEPPIVEAPVAPQPPTPPVVETQSEIPNLQVVSLNETPKEVHETKFPPYPPVQQTPPTPPVEELPFEPDVSIPPTPPTPPTPQAGSIESLY